MEKETFSSKFLIPCACFILYNNYLHISVDLSTWVDVYIRLYERFCNFNPKNVYYFMHALGFFR